MSSLLEIVLRVCFNQLRPGSAFFLGVAACAHFASLRPPVLPANERIFKTLRRRLPSGKRSGPSLPQAGSVSLPGGHDMFTPDRSEPRRSWPFFLCVIPSPPRSRLAIRFFLKRRRFSVEGQQHSYATTVSRVGG